ncbi:hypothetical protein I4U23_013614 [Adineta vaga]|nr:hypothetical protein I4U23_013614 [Adineta vaga]
MLLKRYSLIRTIIYRRLSSEKPTLHETLKVHRTSSDVFIQPAESLFVYPYRTSVFGGQIIGSAMYAAQQTLVKDFPLHSLHSYFLAAADNSSAISYTVKRLRDGKSFETRSVTARQDDKIIFECEMSFHRKEKGNLAHQPVMPDVGVVPPEELHSTRYRFQNLLNDQRLKPELRPFVELALEMPARIDIRHCHPRDLLRPSPGWPARQLVWIKAIDSLPDDSHLHRSAVAYCSDRVLLTSALLPYALNVFSPRIKMQASLDHSMWFHDDFTFDTATSQSNQSTDDEYLKPIRRSADIPPLPLKLPVRADDWLLYELECPIATNNRALTFGRIWTRNGRLVVTCVQEGVIRCY